MGSSRAASAGATPPPPGAPRTRYAREPAMAVAHASCARLGAAARGVGAEAASASSAAGT